MCRGRTIRWAERSREPAHILLVNISSSPQRHHEAGWVSAECNMKFILCGYILTWFKAQWSFWGGLCSFCKFISRQWSQRPDPRLRMSQHLRSQFVSDWKPSEMIVFPSLEGRRLQFKPFCVLGWYYNCINVFYLHITDANRALRSVRRIMFAVMVII